MSWPRRPKAPWWFTALLVVLAWAATMVFPEASTVLDSAEWMGTDYVAWLYPLYIIMMTVLAWMCYPARRTMSWILVGVLALTSLGLFITTLAHTPA